MSLHTNVHALSTTLSGRIQMGQKKWLLLLLFILYINSVNIKPPRHHFGLSLYLGLAIQWKEDNAQKSMHIIQWIKYIVYKRKHRIKCIEFSLWNTLHRIQWMEYNSLNKKHRTQCREYIEQNRMYRIQCIAYNK